MQLDSLMANARAERKISWAALVSYSDCHGGDIQAACDAAALRLAREYLSGNADWEISDVLINSLYSRMTSEEFWALTDRTIPGLAMEIYEAFDMGEYHHRGDPPDIDPQCKYTRPLLQKILSEHP